jgi:AraC-like DNA-binding protein
VAIETPARISIDTADPDEAHSYLQTTYVEHSVRLTGSRDHFRFRHHITDGGNFFVARYEHSMNCQVDTDPFGFLLIGQVARGRLRLQAGEHHDLTPGQGELFLIDPHTPMRINWEDFKAGLVKLDLDVVQRVAAETTGNPGAHVRFGLSKAVSAERARHWHHLVRYVAQDFCNNELAYTSPLIYGHTMRLLAATVLETFPNTTMGATPERPGSADASAVRRAVAYIDDHAAEPIGLAEIAAAARLGTRTVQEAFRRHLDTTPVAYLRRVRRERAHRDLRAADATAGTTVAEVAARWGFAHHGRFAALYQERYGHAPSQTLRT